MNARLGVDAVRAARAIVQDEVHCTPCLSFATGAKLAGGDRLFLKCENLQKVGAFKARGALHYLKRVRAELGPQGVITYSSGNHGAATAWAASKVGVPAQVVVPLDAPASKVAATEAYGARVHRAGRTSADRKAAAEKRAAADSLHLVPPFDHPWIVAGQGTVGLEILEQCPQVRRILVPVGGGGLFSGIVAAVLSQRSDLEVVGVEAENAASMTAALQVGKPVPIEVGESIADGLRPNQVGALCHELIAAYGARVCTVPDAWILRALKLLLERARLVVEPSGAAALAAYLYHPEVARDGTSCVVLSGGNVDASRLGALIF